MPDQVESTPIDPRDQFKQSTSQLGLTHGSVFTTSDSGLIPVICKHTHEGCSPDGKSQQWLTANGPVVSDKKSGNVENIAVFTPCAECPIPQAYDKTKSSK